MSTDGGCEGGGCDCEATTVRASSDLPTRFCGCVLVSTVLLVAELELLILAPLKLFMLLRMEPFSVGGAKVLLELHVLLPPLLLLLLLLLACLVGSPVVFTAAAASFSSVRLSVCVCVCVCVCM